MKLRDRSWAVVSTTTLGLLAACGPTVTGVGTEGDSEGSTGATTGSTTNPDPMQHIGEVSTQDFVDLMITNALGPMRVVERLCDRVRAAGLIGVMSSGQGSISDNESGQRELYRGSKAALNQFMRSFAARQVHIPRAMALIAPGWVRTELGGPQGRLSIEESVPGVVNVLLDKLGRPGLEYLDYLGRTVRW